MADIQEQFEITTPAHWKALSHPLRLSLLERLKAQAMTNEELAQALGVPSGKLYFHTKMLRDAGLISQVETRQKGPITEKLYRAVARSYVAASPSTTSTEAPLADLVMAGLTLYRHAWQDNPSQMDAAHFGFHLVASLPVDRLRDLTQRFRALVEEMRAEVPTSSDTQTVALTGLLHSLTSPITEENK